MCHKLFSTDGTTFETTFNQFKSGYYDCWYCRQKAYSPLSHVVKKKVIWSKDMVKSSKGLVNSSKGVVNSSKGVVMSSKKVVNSSKDIVNSSKITDYGSKNKE